MAKKTFNFPPELENLLLVSINEDWQAITAAYDTSDWKLFTYHVHRLHGALCYCDATQAKNIARQLENALNVEKQNLDLILIKELYQKLHLTVINLLKN